MTIEQLSVLLVNSQVTNRAKWREALKAAVYKGTTQQVNTFHAAKEALCSTEKFDLVFVAFDMGAESISNFLREIKSQATYQTPPLIVTMSSRTNDTTTKVTQLYLDGVTGFISEPFTISQVVDLLHIVVDHKDVTGNSNKVRKSAALLMREAALHLDSYAQRWGETGKKGYAYKHLKSTSDSLKTLYELDPDNFVKSILDAFLEIEKPTYDTSKKKVSNKKSQQIFYHPGILVKQIMEQKALSMEKLKALLVIDPAQLEGVIACSVEVNELIAQDLSRLLGKSAQEWLKMQRDYDSSRPKEPAVEPP